jgi:hypothetical protein
MECAQHALRLTIVAKRPPRGADSARDRSIRDEPALPDGRDQFILRDHPVTRLDKVKNEVEHLRLDLGGCARHDDLACRRINDDGFGDVFHRNILAPALPMSRGMPDLQRAKAEIPQPFLRKSPDASQARHRALT